jgi:hypothetical protein
MTKTRTKGPEFIDVAAIEAELIDETSEDLKEQFWSCYNRAVELIARAGVCAKILKSRHEDIARFPSLATFLLIGEGQLMPELFWMFIESPNLDSVQHLPKTAQEEIVAKPSVAVAEPIPGGGWTKRMYDLTKAPKHIIKIAVSDEGLRTIDEQREYIATQKARPVVAPNGDDIPEGPLTHQIAVKLTDAEWQALRIDAARNNVSEREMARRYMISEKALKPHKG